MTAKWLSHNALVALLNLISNDEMLINGNFIV